MKTNNKLSAYIRRGCTGALLFSCVIVALCSAINLPAHPRKAASSQDNAVFGANGYQTRTLTFADRVAYQRAIEDVYWRHRIWPDTHAGPKPSLDAVISQAQLEKKVEDYLRNSQALEDYWQRPISADQLQAEMERMASNTRQPEVLREIFEALGNDPFVIAECLARPVLAERLVNDDPVAAGVLPAQPTRLPPQRLIAQVPVTMAAVSSANYTLPVIGSPSGGCTDDTWTPMTLTNAPAGRYRHTAVWTGSEMIVWGGTDGTFYLNTGGRYDPSTDSWTATTPANAPAGRYFHTAVWTGSEMIVWGGEGSGPAYLNTGGRYDPSTDSWAATTTINAPAARWLHTAVWTGTEMIVWGGEGSETTYLKTGGRYDPSTNSWTATTTINAPAARLDHEAVWTGNEMIVWGGADLRSIFNTGGRYNPGTDSWTATSTTNAPSARAGHTVLWTGSEMIVWGGVGIFNVNTGGRYDPETDSWTATTTNNAPSPRNVHVAVWTNSEMIVWGGSDGTVFDTGGRYNPSTDSWTATTTNNVPEGRFRFAAVWTDSEMIIWGGYNFSSGLNTGGRYCVQSGSYPTRRRHHARPTPTPYPR